MNTDEPLTSHVRPATDVVLTIRIVKSFPYRNAQEPYSTIGQLEGNHSTGFNKVSPQHHKHYWWFETIP